MKKRVLIISDTHCGHKVGLTPPDWWVGTGSGGHYMEKVATIQRELWKWFKKRVDEIKPIHTLIHAGDMIDGVGKRSGGTEQITTDREEQAQMAAYIIDYISPVNFHAVYGTGYHVGDAEDWESIVLNLCRTPVQKKISDVADIDINGYILNVKHHMGGSQSVTGGLTAYQQEVMWNIVWARKRKMPPADLIVRGHIHKFRCIQEHGAEVMSCHALQGLGTKYGARRCRGTVTMGIQGFDVDAHGNVEDGIWHEEATLDSQKPEIVKF